MIGVKDAVKSATAFVRDMYPEARDIRLEEVEPHSERWSVVVSFRTGEPATLNQVLGMGLEERLFKTIAVDNENGDPLTLKVWKQ